MKPNQNTTTSESQLARAFVQMTTALIGLLQQQRLVQEHLPRELAAIRGLFEEFLSKWFQTFAEQESAAGENPDVGSTAPDEVEDVSPDVHSIAEILAVIQRSQKRLETDHIQRQVIDPIFRKLLRFYTELIKRKDQDSETNSVLLEELDKLFEEYGLMVIEPGDGSPYDPKKHKAISTCPTELHGSCGQISQTIVVGLESNQRIIKTAQVEIYSTSQNHKQTTKREIL